MKDTKSKPGKVKPNQPKIEVKNTSIRGRPPKIEVKDMSNQQKSWKRQSLIDHLETLLDSLKYAMEEYIRMRESFELNIPKRQDLEKAIAQMDNEIEETKKQISEL